MHRKSKVNCGIIKISLVFLNLEAIFVIMYHLINCRQLLHRPLWFRKHYIFCDWRLWKRHRKHKDQHWLTTDHLLYVLTIRYTSPPTTPGHLCHAISYDSMSKTYSWCNDCSQCLMTPMWFLALTPALSWLMTHWQRCLIAPEPC